jgi:glycosyltransferase involved in cell wall biosynthesis
LKEKPPTISIGMPVFNGAATICKAIDSLLDQSFSDFELVISDNASDDKTPDICLEYARKDPRVTYSRNDRNIGALANFQKVLHLARGTYFFWAAHDDWWDRHFIASAVSVMKRNPSAVACMGVVHYLKKSGEEFMTHSPPYGLDKSRVADRAYAYFKHGTTDNLIYAVHRTDVLLTAPFVSSTCPEKLIILHSVLSGAIVDSDSMEYYNVVSFKTHDEVVATLALDAYGFGEEMRVFREISMLLYSYLTPTAFLKVFLVFFFKNNWHKFFVRQLFRKVGLV